MFGFVKQIFISAMIFFGCNFLNVNSLKCVSMNNQKCRVIPEIVNVYSDEPVFFPFSIKTSKCSGSCNNINAPYAKLCVPDVVRNINLKVFNLMSRTNETRHVKWQETCKCKCRLDASVCNNKKRWNEDKCRCECKELINKDVCDKGFIWNPSNCDFECDKSCDIVEYLDYENCKCRKELVDKLVEECTENVGEVKITKITLVENENKHKYSSCALYIVLFSITFTINIAVGAYFVYYKYMNHDKKMFLDMIINQQIININGKYQTN